MTRALVACGRPRSRSFDRLSLRRRSAFVDGKLGAFLRDLVVGQGFSLGNLKYGPKLIVIEVHMRPQCLSRGKKVLISQDTDLFSLTGLDVIFVVFGGRPV